MRSGIPIRSSFDIFHPSVAALYFVAVLVLTMACIQPVFAVLSLAAAAIYNVYLRGWRAALQTAAWQIPLLVLIAVINPLVSQTGSTILFHYFGHRRFYLEGLAYGATMGAMLVSVMLWFSNLSHVLTSDKMMQLTGRFLPTIGLMLTMIMRLVPQFMRRGQDIMAVQRACTAAGWDGAQNTGASASQDGLPAGGGLSFWGRAAERSGRSAWKGRASWMKPYFRVTSVLLGWGMEDSLETAEAMRTRGWGAVPKRSTYERKSFRSADGIAVGALAVLVAASVTFAIMACSGYSFYPRMDALAAWWHYVPYAALLAFPLLLKCKERVSWIR